MSVEDVIKKYNLRCRDCVNRSKAFCGIYEIAIAEVTAPTLRKCVYYV